jgi:hypothetical protein
VATPLTAATLVVLKIWKPPGPLLTAILTVELSVVTTFPLASSTSTVMVLSAVPALPVAGAWTIASLVAASKSLSSRHSIAAVPER